ncbi:TIGR03984 family CRISPR-associated protein [Thermoleptolyngbya sichuanensis A183]|uniref:TIGR03984 family CRISPR-associated protein n=1 Tax=Thermoleptolyngbya sichuanensis A183 TaxID=2737172 RepID=A0A6M8B7Q2_9CYAN|nr:MULTISPECIES: CRISPR-associated protein Csx19 [Thermoleptolyngbya]QKD83389.1 TIGR03984 family CRISPR-associated protein [Thermoleptolyngbya sichuanensis A183]
MSEAVATKTKLYRQSKMDISLEDALNQVKDLMSGAIALLYSPQACSFGRFESNGQVTICCNSKQGNSKQDWQEQTLDLSSVFEARVFNERAELRWLSIPGSKGKAVLISETNLEKKFADDTNELNYLKAVEQKYLLWGEPLNKVKQPAPANWSILSAARIGAMPVPISPGSNNQTVVELHSREYLGEIEPYGNVAVQEERLMKLTWISTKKVNTNDK